MTSAYTDYIWQPERNLSFWDILLAAGETGNSVTVGDRRFTYKELAERADRLAGGLRTKGVHPGDRVAFVMSDRMEIVELAFAMVRLGAILVPINPYLKGLFLRHQLELSDPATVIVDQAGLDSVRGLLDGLPLVGLFAVEEVVAGDLPVSIAPFDDLYGDPIPDADHDPDGRLPMSIMFTSGTTGDSKGCTLSRAYQIKVGAVISQGYGATSDDVIFSALPLFHSAALVSNLMGGVVTGASVHLTGAFHASTFMVEAAQAGATITVCIGAMGPMLMAQPRRDTDTAHRLRIFHCVPMSLTKQEEFRERFNVQPWTESLGLTECMIITFGQRNGVRKPTSCGRATEVSEVAILDDDGHPVPPGTAGEICVRPKTSGTMYSGYWRNPEATIKAWNGLWFHTGDNGMMDEDGFLYFLDRKKDAIRRRGENVSSIELEAAIGEHPSVKQVAVHAVSSELAEDEIKACLMLHEGHSVTPEAIFTFFRANLPYFAIPRYVECLEEFPMTSNSKVKKDVLRARPHSDNCWDLEGMGLSVPRDQRRAVG